jgi:hypothetical protein
MRRLIPVSVLALVLFASPPMALAQTDSDQVLFDTTIVMQPPDIEHLCMQIGAGRLTVSAKLVDPPSDGQQRRTGFDLEGDEADPGASVTMLISTSETTSTATLAGGVYCWRLRVASQDLPPGVGLMGGDQLTALKQSVALRMSLASQ